MNFRTFFPDDATDFDEFYKGLKIENVVGGTFHKEKKYVLVKWLELDEHDLVPFEFFQGKYPKAMSKTDSFSYFDPYLI